MASSRLVVELETEVVVEVVVVLIVVAFGDYIKNVVEFTILFVTTGYLTVYVLVLT